MSEKTLTPKEKIETPVMAKTVEGEGSGAALEVAAVQTEQLEKIVDLSHDAPADEIVEETVTASGFSFSGFRDAVWRMIRSKRPVDVKIPSESTQRRKLQKTFHREIRKMTRQANRMLSSRRFSASKYEELLTQIRHFQSMLKDLAQAVTEQLETWFKQYVLKIA